jgi:dipeptidyl aminopeptidase/acylaminoacyl peptidase
MGQENANISYIAYRTINSISMKSLLSTLLLACLVFVATGQEHMTPELLWSLGRVSGAQLTTDGKSVIYNVSTPNIADNKSTVKKYIVALAGGEPKEISDTEGLLKDKSMAPGGKHRLIVQDVRVHKVAGKEFYPDLSRSDARIYDQLGYRHWDSWEDGIYSHLYVMALDGTNKVTDIMMNEPFDCPQQPFGGDEDYTWSPDGNQVIYVTKKKSGTAYVTSTNTDIYSYDVTTGKTTNLSEGMMGYDTQPAFSSTGVLAWLSMKRDGYESDKNDIIVQAGLNTFNLTEHWDGTVNSFVWSSDGKKIFFTAPVHGTIQLFEVTPQIPLSRDGKSVEMKKPPVIRQITSGAFDITGIVGQNSNSLVATRTDMNHAAELYSIALTKGEAQQLSHVNDAIYGNIKLSRVESRIVKTTDNKDMPVFVIYPPDFDPARKYPTLLYCQGGPQVALTQFYSYRWNFQLMAAQGYIVVAPDRRGMPGMGVAWNEQISGDWGGQVMKDYLSAIDQVAQEPFVDKSRLGCVGASYGGYSAFYLAGIHENRFKTFIAHDGVFNLRSMYGTTEEMWFVNWDLGGPYWQKDAAIQKTYKEFDPSEKVDQWNTPILIFQGGRDYRVPIGQGLEAFTAAQMRGIKSRLVYFPEENHWILTAQNALVWQREFFSWLKETL